MSRLALSSPQAARAKQWWPVGDCVCQGAALGWPATKPKTPWESITSREPSGFSAEHISSTLTERPGRLTVNSPKLGPFQEAAQC